MKHRDYWTCEYGFTHDHNEQCDCEKKESAVGRKLKAVRNRANQHNQRYDTTHDPINQAWRDWDGR